MILKSYYLNKFNGVMLQFLWKHAAQNASYCKNKTTQRRRCICMIPQLLSWLCQEGLAVKRNKWGMAVETCHVIVCIHQSLMMYQSLLNGKSPVCRHFCVLSLYVPYFLPLSHKRLMRYCCHPAGRADSVDTRVFKLDNSRPMRHRTLKFYSIY